MLIAVWATCTATSSNGAATAITRGGSAWQARLDRDICRIRPLLLRRYLRRDACAPVGPRVVSLSRGTVTAPPVRLLFVSDHSDTLEMYAGALQEAGLDVQRARGLHHVPVRSMDVAVIQLRPGDDARRIGGTLRRVTDCSVLVALVAFNLELAPGVFDRVLPVPLMPADLVRIICSMVPC